MRTSVTRLRLRHAWTTTMSSSEYRDTMLATKVEHLLRFTNVANCRACKFLTAEEQAKGFESQRL